LKIRRENYKFLDRSRLSFKVCLRCCFFYCYCCFFLLLLSCLLSFASVCLCYTLCLSVCLFVCIFVCRYLCVVVWLFAYSCIRPDCWFLVCENSSVCILAFLQLNKSMLMFRFVCVCLHACLTACNCLFVMFNGLYCACEILINLFHSTFLQKIILYILYSFLLNYR